jgi:hypothetical protein
MKLQAASRMLDVLYCLRHIFRLSSMLQLNRPPIHPHFEYCSNLLHLVSLKIMELTEKSQKKAMQNFGCVYPLKENIFLFFCIDIFMVIVLMNYTILYYHLIIEVLLFVNVI